MLNAGGHFEYRSPRPNDGPPMVDRRRVAPAQPWAPQPVAGAPDLLAELDTFARRVAASPSTSAAPLADELAVQLYPLVRDLADHAAVARPPTSSRVDASTIAAATWAAPLAAAVSAAAEAIGKPSRRWPPYEVDSRRYRAERVVAECRTAVRVQLARLDQIEKLHARRAAGVPGLRSDRIVPAGRR